MNDWWADFYNDTIADLFLVRDEGPELDFLASKLALRPGALVFDQCCGIGNLAAGLARRGFRTVGVDLCAPYVERARRDAAGLPCEFAHADAFEFRPDRPCDAAFNWYSSFGYADADDRNLEMLRRAFESLTPGGRFALDFLNAPAVYRNFQPRMERGRDGGARVVRECALDVRRGRLEQRWTTTDAGGRASSRSSSVKLYAPHQLAELFERAGFRDVELFGGVDGAPLALDSSRCVALGRRP